MHNYFIHKLLSESYFHILFEDFRLDKIEQMVNKRLKPDEQLDTDQIQIIVGADPTSHGDSAGKYSEWLIKQYIQLDNNYRNRFFEDLYKYTDALKTFHELKTRNKISQKDINKVKNLQELQDMVEDDSNTSILSGFPDTKELEENGDVEVILRTPEFHIYNILTYEGDVELGSNTRWCTVANEKYFNHYTKELDIADNIFIIYHKTGNKIERFQYHFRSNQFMDEQDEQDKSLIDNSEIKSAFIKFAFRNKNIYIALLYRDPVLLNSLKSQIIRKAVWGYLLYTDDEQEHLEAINEETYAIAYIQNPSEKVQELAVTLSSRDIKYIKNPTKKVQLIAVMSNGYLIQHIKNPDRDVQVAAIKSSPSIILHIDNPDEELQLLAVSCAAKNDVRYMTYYITNPTEKVQLICVKSNGNALEYIVDQGITPSEDVQIAAVLNNSRAIQWIKNPSEKVQLASVFNNAEKAIKTLIGSGVKLSEKVQLSAVKRDLGCIEYIEHPTEKVQMYVIQQDWRLWVMIDNICDKAKNLAIKKRDESMSNFP